MIKNYNGKIDYQILHGLSEICDIYAKNRIDGLEENAKNGGVNVFIKGELDEFSKIKILKSEEEITKYMKKEFESRIDVFLASNDSRKEYLLNAVVGFIKQNYRYPTKPEMDQLEKVAEVERIKSLPSVAKQLASISADSHISINEVNKEILELARDVYESRFLTRPNEIKHKDAPYSSSLYLNNGKFSATIEYNRHNLKGNIDDYKLSIRGVGKLPHKSYNFYGEEIQSGIKAGCYMVDVSDQYEADVPKKTLIAIHKNMVKIAKKEEIEFKSEIKYGKVTGVPAGR